MHRRRSAPCAHGSWGSPVRYVENSPTDAIFAGSIPRVAAFVGGGGKTTTITALTNELVARGRSVVSTTTTKMYPPENLELLSSTTEEAARILQKSPMCYAGIVVQEKHKMRGLPDAERLALSSVADIVLIEADGSRGRPLKMTRDYEPVIPPEAELVVLVVGLDCIGAKIGECCHCPELACELLGVAPEHIVTASDAVKILRASYFQKISAQTPNARTLLLLNKHDGGGREKQARELAAALPDFDCVVR